MRACALVGLLALAACAAPSPRYDREARYAGFSREDIAGAGFAHAVYRNRAARDGAPGDLHVYLEGDGTPWVNGRHVAVDPTPGSPVALELMAHDSAPSILLGRPCYHGHYADPGCRPLLWTSGRYSETVVASMAQALSTAARGGAQLTLIGHSGGGALAMLLAERVEAVDTVITVAANLDVAAWTAVHDYEPLSASLDPSARPALPLRIRQVHLAGGRDSEVPAELIVAAARRQPGARVVVRPEFDHACCWARDWRELITQAAPEPVASLITEVHTRAPISAQ
jgi:hypothetical protein